MSQIPTFDWNCNNAAEAFKLFRQSLELYFQVKEVKKELQVPTLLLALGTEGLKRFNSWSLTDAQRVDVKHIFKSFLEQLEPPTNFRISRLSLSKFSQKQNESLDDFISRCKLKALECEFDQNELQERIIELIIASTPIPDFQKELLMKPKGFKLSEALTLGRTFEASSKHLQQLQSMASVPVSAVDRNKQTRRQNTGSCWNCGNDHKRGKEHCPARDDTCRSCGKTGHWASKCLTSKLSKKTTAGKQHRTHKRHQKRLYTVENSNVSDPSDSETADTDEDTIQFNTVKLSETMTE